MSAGCQVLVVDDDRDVGATLALALELEGFPTHVASDGAEALRYLREGHRPRLILLDLMMPGMNGWEFRAAQVADPALAALPVVVLSADSRVDDKARGLHVADTLRKPIDLEALLSVVGRFVGPASTGAPNPG